jgi:hypothetical protein
VLGRKRGCKRVRARRGTRVAVEVDLVSLGKR